MDSASRTPIQAKIPVLDPKSIGILLHKVSIAAMVNVSIALLAWLAIPATSPPYWLLLILTASLIRFFPGWLAARNPALLGDHRFSWLLLATVALQGVGWGYGSTQLFLAAPEMQKFLVLTISCGMVGGSILTLAPSVSAYLCFALPATLPLLCTMFLGDQPAYHYAAIMGAVFLVAIYLLSRNICRNHLDLLASQRRLEETSAELVRHQHHLEQLVDARTRDLQEAKENYRRLIEEIHDVIYEIDQTGDIRYVSPAITPLLGYHPEELTGRNVRDIAHPDDHDLIFLRIATVLSGGEQFPIDSRFMTRDGRICWLRITSQAIIVDGRPAGLRGVATGIDREKRAEEERNELAKRIQQARKLESIGTLAGGIAHDFNNLLMGIQGRITLLAMSFPSRHPNLEHTQAIERYVQSGAALTKQLLATARGGKYEPMPTDIARLVQQTIHLFGRTRKELDIKVAIPESQTVANVDKSQIEQVLLNMFVNSSQAMVQGGTLKVSVTELELDPSFCRPYKIDPGPYIEITVADTGIGMAPETLDRIFDPFFTTKEMGRGTGLGLSSAHGIIANHQGCITVMSSPGKGTTFAIYLPRSTSRPRISPPAATEVNSGKETILLVDDEEMIIDVAGAILTKLGYTVVAARSGQQAIELLRQHGEQVHLVLLDMIMPGMDGDTTFDALRAIRPNLPILLSSGYALNDQAMAIMQRGCNGFIEKPFTLAALSARIRAILDTSLN